MEKILINNALEITKQTHGHKDNWDIHVIQMLNYGYEICDYIEKEQKILDIGYGWGTISIACHLNGNDVWAIDLFQKPMNYPQIKWIYPLDIENPETKLPQKYDTIILSEVIEHFRFNPQKTLQKITESLHPNGKLIITTPILGVFKPDAEKTITDMTHFEEGKALRDSHHCFYTKEDLKAMVRVIEYKEIGVHYLAVCESLK